jgi:predicted transcriptional regulator
MPAEPTVQATFNMSPDLHQRLTERAGIENRTMRAIMEHALNDYLSKPQSANVVRSEGDQDEPPQKAKP